MVYLVNCHISPQLPKTLGVSTSMKEFIGRLARRSPAMSQTSPGSLRPPTTWVDAIHQLFAMNLEVAQVYSEVRMKFESSGTFRWFSIRVFFVGFRRFQAMKLLKGDANKFLSSCPERNDEKYPKWFLNSFDALTKNWAVVKTNDYFLYTRGSNMLNATQSTQFHMDNNLW